MKQEECLSREESYGILNSRHDFYEHKQIRKRALKTIYEFAASEITCPIKRAEKSAEELIKIGILPKLQWKEKTRPWIHHYSTEQLLTAFNEIRTIQRARPIHTTTDDCDPF